MHLMPHATPVDTGWIEVVCGCMFSGKTEELIRRLKRAEIAKLNVKIFKPQIDTRFSSSEIVSHSEKSMPSEMVASAEEILEKVGNAQVIGIDEVQFFDEKIVDVCNQLAEEGRRVIVAGLDQDYRGIPFEPIPQILSIAEYITKTLAICIQCGNPANKTQRLVTSGERVLVGASDSYEARCRKCHYIPKSE